MSADAVEGGTLLPAKTVMEPRRPVEIARDDLIRQLQELRRGIGADLTKLHEEVERDLDAYIIRPGHNTRVWTEQANRSVEKHLRRACAYLWILLCPTGFLTVARQGP